MKVIIAGGGTGGHLFPALALAESFRERDPENQILFAGSRRGLEASLVAKEGYALQTIQVAGLKGKTFWGKMQTLSTIPRGLLEAAHLIRSFRPDLILGVGGYASGPVVLAGSLMGYRTAIHEQNSFPGLSNRILGRFVDRVFISFADSAPYFPAKRTVLTGNPVRARLRSQLPAFKKGSDKSFTLLVFGGSQGAHPLNRAMEDALPHLAKVKAFLRIIHQTGERDCEAVKEAYRRAGFEAEVSSFIYDMERVYRAADLVLCRAGATTLFELMALGKPAILVPYPHAANDHQTQNAATLTRAGAALMVANGSLNGAGLSRILQELIFDPRRLQEMGDRARTLAQPEAARRIVDLCYRLVGYE